MAFGGVFQDLAAAAVLQQGEGNRQLVAGVQPLVGYEAVDLRDLGHHPHIGGDHDLHEGDFVALLALGHDVAGQLFKVHLVIGHDLRVAAHGHDVGGQSHDGVDILYQITVAAVSEHTIILLRESPSAGCFFYLYYRAWEGRASIFDGFVTQWRGGEERSDEPTI